MSARTTPIHGSRTWRIRSTAWHSAPSTTSWLEANQDQSYRNPTCSRESTKGIKYPHPAVRAAAATYLLESDPELAMATLDAGADETKGVRGQTMTAYMTLKEWNAGRLSPTERLLRDD